VLVHQLRQHLVLLTHFGLQGLDAARLRQRGARRLGPRLVEHAGPFFEQLLPPLVEHGRLQSVLLANLGDRLVLDQMRSQDGDLLSARKIPSFFRHGTLLRLETETGLTQTAAFSNSE
jgi:hypothetical protein